MPIFQWSQTLSPSISPSLSPTMSPNTLPTTTVRTIALAHQIISFHELIISSLVPLFLQSPSKKPTSAPTAKPVSAAPTLDCDNFKPDAKLIRSIIPDDIGVNSRFGTVCIDDVDGMTAVISAPFQNEKKGKPIVLLYSSFVFINITDSLKCIR
jgi:hypothetical protein